MRRVQPIYGLVAEFAGADALVHAAKQTSAAGYRRIDAFSPFPVEGLADALGFRHNRLPLLVLCGGILGGVGGYFMQYYAAVVSYPINVGGRPLHSWPSFIPITFEMTVLVAALFALIGMLALNGSAHALSSALQRAALCVGEPRSLFFVHRKRGPAF